MENPYKISKTSYFLAKLLIDLNEQYQRLFMIHRLIKLQNLTKTVTYNFSGPLMPNSQKIEEKQQAPKEEPKTIRRPWFVKLQSQKTETKKQDEGDPNSRFTSSKTLDYLVNKINEVNNYYLGVRHNTKYLRVNRLIKYQQAAKLKASGFTINDFPIELAKGINTHKSFEAFQSIDQSKVLSKKAGQIAFSHCRLQPVLSKIQQLVHQYFLSVTSENRFKRLEPNFELQNIKMRNIYKDTLKLTLNKAQEKPQIKIKDITLFKGVGAIRNDNYSTDSYQRDESELADGIVKYMLYRQRKQRYPEREWLTTQYINARFEVLVKGGPAIEVKDKEFILGSSQPIVHNVVVQADLIPPPTISLHQLTPQQYLRSYRLVANKLMITNFDRKNQFFGLTYTEAEKREVLYNGVE